MLANAGNSLLEELEALIAEDPSLRVRQGGEGEVGGPVEEAIDPLEELDRMIAGELESKREANRVKDSRERLKRGGQSLAEREADLERIHTWELRHEWKAAANVAVFIEQHCESCGAVHRTFEQLMLRQVHRHVANSQRWQAASAIMANLPNETVVRRQSVPLCAECCHRAGFDVDRVTAVWES